MRIEWVRIPAGEFLMGLSEEQAQGLEQGMSWLSPVALESLLKEETPQRVIIVNTFYISRFPITRGQYAEFHHGGHPEKLESVPPHPVTYHPMTCLWHEARAFCAWLGARLPSSIEWEKAARGTDGRLYPWGDEWDLSRGNFGQKDRRGRVQGRKTSPVDAYPEGASPYEVYDMMGNCYEWTMTLDVPVPRCSKSGLYRQTIVIRGCDADPDAMHPWAHRVTQIMHGGVFEDEFPPYTGFRPVMDEWQRQHWQGF
jgi:formylglycine-generating enzyme required for sulfatase activity